MECSPFDIYYFRQVLQPYKMHVVSQELKTCEQPADSFLDAHDYLLITFQEGERGVADC